MQPNNVQPVLATGKNFEYALFQIAISFAENGFHVWFISPETFERAPKNMKPPDKEVLQLITFMYLKDYTDLVTHLNGIHLWRKIPNIIIVTKFESYCNFSEEYNPLQAALVLTCLLDSAAVCVTKKNEKINLLVTCSESVDKDQLQVLKDLYFSKHVEKTEDDEFCKNILQLLK